MRLPSFVAFALVVPVVACSTSSTDEGPSASTEQAQISDIQTMTQRADGNFDVLCKDGTREIVTAAQIAVQQVCRGGGGGGGGGNRIVIYGRSDSCSDDYAVASVTPNTECTTLSDADVAWSVKVGGRCINISDTTVRKACFAHQPGRAVIYGRSDSCSEDYAVASVGPNTECGTLSDADVAWSVKVDGQCKNISDTTVRRACFGIQPGRVIIYGRSDSCSDDYAVASVGPNTDCQTLSDSEVAWSVKVDGRCNNISDTTVRKACISHQP